MSRILSIAFLLLAALSLNAADRFSPDPEQISIATTGRIVKLDLKNKTLKVRGADAQISGIAQGNQGVSLMQRIGLTLPRGIWIELPGRSSKRPTKPASAPTNNLDEFTVIVTNDTVFQDGSDPLRLEDFKVGETISIHGVLHGSTLTASRIAKWS